MLKESLSLLLSLFYSKKESALVANQAMPGNSKIEITATSAPGDWQTVATYTAPCAGIASLRGQAINNTAFMQIMLEAGEPGKESPSITGFATTGQYPHIWLNVKKGDQIVFKAGAITQVFARFFKTVGGGYKGIIWRAVLCLSSYSSYYLKHSLNPKNLGSVIRPCRHLHLLHTLMLKGKNGCTLPLLMTDTFTLWQDKQPALIFQQRLYLYCLHRMEENFLNRLSRLRKAVFSGISFMEEPRRTKQRLLSFQSTARCNLNVGGALC